MCNSCFNTEINKFESQAFFEVFDLLLTKKLANDKTIMMKDWVGTAWKDVGFQVYQCTDCGQLWALRTPDYIDRGYFLAITQEVISRGIDPKTTSR